MPDSQPISRNAQSQSRPQEPSLALAETLRIANASPTDEKPKGEDRMPLLWRVFGGTVLSILALVGVTTYQQFNNAINDLRSSIVHLNETNSELLRKEEFSSRLTSVWNSVKALQDSQGTVASLKERSLVRDQQISNAEDRREEMVKQIQALEGAVALFKERAMQRDQQLKTDAETIQALQKESQALNGVVTGLKERALVQEQQAKYDEERKEMVKELQRLRERVACMEGRNTVSKSTPPEGN